MCTIWNEQLSQRRTGIRISLFFLLVFIRTTAVQAQCTTASAFTKINNAAGTVSYPGTNGNAPVNVTATSTGRASIITFCNITNGFRAGEQDRNGAYRFAFAPAVSGILININAVSNNINAREIVRILINGVAYTLRQGQLVCSGNCYGCNGTPLFIAGGVINADTSNAGNGSGQLLIQGAGPISSIEYSNELQDGDPQGSVFEIFFNNSSCQVQTPLPVTLSSFTASGAGIGVQLSWTVAIQQNTDQYELEQSRDGIQFSVVTKIPAKNSSNYGYNDLAAEAGTTYYRLKMIDADGSFVYSKVVSTITRGPGNKPVLFDALSGTLLVTGLQGNSTITVHAANGNQVAKIITGKPTETISTNSWSTGVYMVTVMSNGKELHTEKIFKR